MCSASKSLSRVPKVRGEIFLIYHHLRDVFYSLYACILEIRIIRVLLS
jgi:hypothetical protein